MWFKIGTNTQGTLLDLVVEARRGKESSVYAGKRGQACVKEEDERDAPWLRGGTADMFCHECAGRLLHAKLSLADKTIQLCLVVSRGSTTTGSSNSNKVVVHVD